MSDKGFDLGNYVEVKDRLAILYELFPKARVMTTYELTSEPDAKPKVICRAMVYRDTDDTIPVTGTSWMYLPGTSSFTRGSEIENAETSAVGRAIGLMGILIDKSIATTNEIESKQDDRPRTHTGHRDGNPGAAKPVLADPEAILEGTYNGTGAVLFNAKPPADGNVRDTPDGPVLVFKFEEAPPSGKEKGQHFPQVFVRGSMVYDLLDAADGDLKGMVCTISGDVYRVTFTPEGTTASRTFQRLELKHIRTAGWTLPVPVAPGQVGAFDAATEAELDGAL